jgi:hypothetical protein
MTMPFKSEEDTRRAGILRVAELAIAQLQAAGRGGSAEAELRSAITKAKENPMSSMRVEQVRLIMMRVPELEALLREEFPEGLHPPPFHGTQRRLRR